MVWGSDFGLNAQPPTGASHATPMIVTCHPVLWRVTYPYPAKNIPNPVPCWPSAQRRARTCERAHRFSARLPAARPLQCASEKPLPRSNEPTHVVQCPNAGVKRAQRALLGGGCAAGPKRWRAVCVCVWRRVCACVCGVGRARVCAGRDHKPARPLASSSVQQRVAARSRSSHRAQAQFLYSHHVARVAGARGAEVVGRGGRRDGGAVSVHAAVALRDDEEGALDRSSSPATTRSDLASHPSVAAPPRARRAIGPARMPRHRALYASSDSRSPPLLLTSAVSDAAMPRAIAVARRCY